MGRRRLLRKALAWAILLGVGGVVLALAVAAAWTNPGVAVFLAAVALFVAVYLAVDWASTVVQED